MIDFQDAESVRSGNSHVTSQPVSFPPHPIPEGMLKPFYTNRRAAKMGRQAFRIRMVYIGKRFWRSGCVFYSTLSAGIESMEIRHMRTDSLINGGEE